MTPETTIKHTIKQYLKYSGFFTYPNMQGLGCHPGLSDIVAIKDGTVIFIEVKAEKGRQSDNQIKFEKDVKDHGGNYMVARGVDDIDAYLKAYLPHLRTIRLF